MKKTTIALSLSLLLLTACNESNTDTPAGVPDVRSDSADLEIADVAKTEDGLTMTIKNTGAAESDEFEVNVKLYKGGEIVGEFDKEVDSLAINGDYAFSTSFSGTAYDEGEVTVDSRNAVTENNETNNSASF